MEHRYQMIEEVGKGAFGSVSKAFDNRSKGYVAIKKLFYDRRYEQRELSTLAEIKERGLCNNIIELKDRYFKNLMERG